MALYFEYLTDVAEKGKGGVIGSTWTHTEPPIVAVATKNGDISLFAEEGDDLDPEVVLHRGRGGGVCTFNSFHPKSALLASGWDDGCISLWSDKDRSFKEETSVHKAAITLLQWSPEGSRLISGDQGGLLVVWEIENRTGKLNPLCQFNKKGAVTHLVFRNNAPSAPTDPSSLVVNVSVSCPSFFYGTSSGMVYFADDLNHCSEVISTGSPLNTMYYSNVNEYLVVVTVDVVLYKYKISDQGRMSQERKVKLSIKGDGSELKCVFAGAGLLAAANNEPLIRIWHLERDDSYILPLSNPAHLAAPKDTLIAINFNPASGVLAASTTTGRVCMWKYHGSDNPHAEPSESDWEVLPPVQIESHEPIYSISWGPSAGLLSLNCKESCSILNETVLHARYIDGNSLVQTSAETLLVQVSDGKPVKIHTTLRVKGVEMNEKYVLLWNGKRAEVRELFKDGNNSTAGGMGIYSSFATRASIAALHNDSIYAAVGSRIEVCNLQGVVKGVLAFGENEGVPTQMHINDGHLAVVTTANLLKVWDISRATPKSIVPGRLFHDRSVMKHVRINANGKSIAILANKVDQGGVQSPDSKVYVYDVDSDKFMEYEFGPKYYPINQHWDSTDVKLMAVETKRGTESKTTKRDDSKEEKKVDESSSHQVVDSDYAEGDQPNGNGSSSGNGQLPPGEVTTMFVTADYGILMQDSFPIDSNAESLVSVSVPFILFMGRPSEGESDGGGPRVRRQTMRDFVGLEKVSEETRKDLQAFSFHLTVGNLDEAYRAVKKISSDSIWENMAQMCVKTKRLDVAEVCLGNMNNARGARALRQAKTEPEKDAAVAMVAIQLGMNDDAERLYRECGRYDLLVKLYIASGRWKDALKICAQHDRIHLKTTHYLYARHLESIGDTANAIKNYEKSESHRHEVPRMLFDSQHMAELEAYIKATDDKALIKWWAQYCESNNAYDEAIKHYEKAGETLALVRVYCYRGDEDKAASICKQTNDAAACYHLARQYESAEKIKEAIDFYTKAKRFNHGIRLAKEHGFDNELLQLALQSSANLKVEAAIYFEAKGVFDKAVLLYEKGGRIPKALELCFKAQLFDSLRTIADSLGADTDPALLSKCADFFLSHSQFDKAVHLFITAQQYTKALALCMKQNVKITDAMAEKMTPPKGKTEEEKNEREEILKKLAHVCKDQGSYHLACKKYTQAGDHIRAMKCLLKSSDTEKIIYYANMTKKKEIYILAANYLQNLDWHSDGSVMEHIINFYTKAKALQQLSQFYDACAQVEIDEYRDYEKALGALKEAMKYLIKGKIENKDDKLASLNTRVAIVEKFVEARKLVKTAPDQMVEIAKQLLDTRDVETAIRTGDVFALLVEYYHSVRNYTEAYAVIERMRAAHIVLSPYLDQGMVQAIHTQVGATMQQDHDPNDDAIGEDIHES